MIDRGSNKAIIPSDSDSAGGTGVGPFEPRTDAAQMEHVTTRQLEALLLCDVGNVDVFFLANRAFCHPIHFFQLVYFNVSGRCQSSLAGK